MTNDPYRVIEGDCHYQGNGEINSTCKVFYRKQWYVGHLTDCQGERASVMFVARNGKLQHVTVPPGRVRIARPLADWFTLKHTAFINFQEMLDAAGGYRPTLRGGGEVALLAYAYDQAQILRCDPRRTYPARPDGLWGTL